MLNKSTKAKLASPSDGGEHKRGVVAGVTRLNGPADCQAGGFVCSSLVPDGKNCRAAVAKCYINERTRTMELIPFSAFWLRSSVVSVLISLISDTWVIDPHDIKLISCGGGSTTVACHWGPRASPLRCTAARARRTPTKPK